MTKKSGQKFKYLKNEKSSSFLRTSVVKCGLRHESASFTLLAKEVYYEFISPLSTWFLNLRKLALTLGILLITS